MPPSPPRTETLPHSSRVLVATCTVPPAPPPPAASSTVGQGVVAFRHVGQQRDGDGEILGRVDHPSAVVPVAQEGIAYGQQQSQ